MPKEFSIVKVCDLITKYSLYALIFLVPIFFLPWTADVLDFNKQALILLLVFVSLFALMTKILIVGKFEINKSFTHTVAGILFLVYFLATAFSVYRYGSFWGMSQQISESMITVLCLLLFYFLLSNIFSKKDILTSAIVFSCSAVTAQLFGVLQFFGLFIVPLDFAKFTAFNTIGSVSSLGFFSAMVLPMAMMLLIVAKKWWKILFVLEIILSVMILVLIGYAMIWWVVAVGSALIIAIGIIKRDLFDGRWLILPMFVFAISLFFALLNPQINWLPQKPNEIFLSQKIGLDMAMQTIKQNPISGSGPGTFAYDFSKFKGPDFSKGPMWSLVFNRSSSKVLNNLTTIGLLGFLGMLAFMILPVLYGIKFFIAKKESDDNLISENSAVQIYSIVLLGLLAVLVEQVITSFIYNSNVVLDFVSFFAIAALIGLISEGKKKYVLKPSSALSLGTILIFTLVFIFGAGFLILNGQRYLAELNYYKGLVAYQTGHNSDGLKNLETAAKLNSKLDVYFRQLSQGYILELKDILKNTNAPSDAQKEKVQTLRLNATDAAQKATDLNPQDVNNWASRGLVYQNLFGILTDAPTLAINSYDSALKLDPNNPYLFAQKGSVYLAEASSLSADKIDQKKQLLSDAQKQLEKAIILNPNYSNALYSLGVVYDSLGQKNKAIDVFTKLQQLNPANPEIAKILSNLMAGKSAF